MNANKFLSLGIVHDKFVVASASGAAIGFETSLDLAARQGEGRTIVAIVYSPGDDRAVGITLQELHNNLLADARNDDRAPTRSGDSLAHANPAGALFIPLALAVPVKLHLNPAMLVRVDLLSLGSGNNGCLRAGQQRPGCCARG